MTFLWKAIEEKHSEGNFKIKGGFTKSIQVLGLQRVLTDYTIWHFQRVITQHLHQRMDAHLRFYHDAAATRDVTQGTWGSP